MRRVSLFIISFLSWALISAQDKNVPDWQEGMLDIHTIATGRGNCQFLIFPDGTTMMIDAGDFDGKGYDNKYSPMRCTVVDESLTPAQKISEYIKSINGDFSKEIDYFLLTHFHTDHYGAVREGLPLNNEGDYYLTGLTELAEYIPINKIIDRGFPTYDFPLNLQNRLTKNGTLLDPSFENYLKFVKYKEKNKSLEREEFVLGDGQFKLKYTPDKFPNFKVSNIKVNNLLWDKDSDKAKVLFTSDEFLGENNKFSENPLSCAIVIEYGDFKYYAGGDNTGLVDQDHEKFLDIETPMSEVIGNITAMTLNHHGNRDATNLEFLKTLDPKVVILQSWSSDHPGQENAHRLISPNIGENKREIYMTNLDPLTGLGIGPWFEKNLTGANCHVLLRVLPDGSYKTFTIDI